MSRSAWVWRALALTVAFCAPHFVRAADYAVMPWGETTMMPDILADAADDPAVWIDPLDPARSFIIGTNKLTDANGGLYLYNLDGSQFGAVLGARMNNVDVRYNFALGEEMVDLVAATDVTHKAIALYRVDASARGLVSVGSIPLSGFTQASGLAMYHSKATNLHYVFVSDNDNFGTIRQYQLLDGGGGAVGGSLVREFKTGSKTEGIIADDELGDVYISEESVAVWKYGASPTAPTSSDNRTAIDRAVSGGGRLTPDIEGLTLYSASDGTGYVIVSSQGNSTYYIYKREGANDFVASFNIVDNEAAGIDGTRYTDGVHVVNGNLGAVAGAYDWTQGLFIAQDDWNIFHTDTSPSGQNFKLVRWSDIVGGSPVPLTIDTAWDPRSVPEPGTLGLAAGGLLALTRRRR